MAERSLRPFRVLMTADTVGGVLTYALTLATELVQRGITVHLATMGAPLRDGQRRDAAAIPGLVVHESIYALEWMNDPWDDITRAGDWLLEIERLVTPDVVHLNGYVHATIGFRAPVVVVGHSCVLSWWEATHGERAPSSFDRYRTEVGAGLAAAAAVIAPTAAMMDCLERHYGRPRFGFVVPNGVPAPSGGRVITKERSVLAAGRLWDRAKNIDALARVAPRFSGPVRVAGVDHTPEGQRRSLPNVELLGWLDRPALARAMDAAAIFVHPARYEPFGLAPVEAALRGCALVLGDIPSLREVWGDAALYVDPDDDDALARALARYADDEMLRRDHAALATARAQTFTPRRMAEGTLDVYGRLVGMRPRGPSNRERGVNPSCA